MQQIQGPYQGDRSDTLAAILGLDYDPQGHMAQMAQQMLSTGMSSSTSLKTAAMQAQAQANRDFVNQQMEMNKARREQTMLRNAAGAQLRGRQQGTLKTLGMYLDMLNQYPDDPYMQREAAALRSQIGGLQGAFSQPGALEERVAMMQHFMDTGMADQTVAGGVAGLADYGDMRREAAAAKKKKEEEAAKQEAAAKEKAEQAKRESEVIDLDEMM